MKHKEEFYTDVYGNEFSEYHRGNGTRIKCQFRYTPVPGNGTNHFNKYCGIYRNPTTRRIKLEAVQGDKYVRGKRRMTYLWDKWDDDTERSNWNAKSWKTCTKHHHQYK